MLKSRPRRRDRKPVVSLTRADATAFISEIGEAGFPHSIIETTEDEIIGLLVTAPTGVWVIDLGAAVGRGPGAIDHVTEAVRAAMGPYAGVDVFGARLRSGGAHEQIEPAGVLRATRRQLTARLYSQGHWSMHAAAAGARYITEALSKPSER